MNNHTDLMLESQSCWTRLSGLRALKGLQKAGVVIFNEVIYTVVGIRLPASQGYRKVVVKEQTTILTEY